MFASLLSEPSSSDDVFNFKHGTQEDEGRKMRKGKLFFIQKILSAVLSLEHFRDYMRWHDVSIFPFIHSDVGSVGVFDFKLTVLRYHQLLISSSSHEMMRMMCIIIILVSDGSWTSSLHEWCYFFVVGYITSHDLNVSILKWEDGRSPLKILQSPLPIFE